MTIYTKSITSMSQKSYILRDVLLLASGYLAERGVERSRFEAEVLLGDLLSCERLRLYLDFARPLSEVELSAFRERIKRRGEGEPTAYILKKKEFMSLEFYVDARVLIPRPETEFLVETAIEKIERTKRKGGSLKIIDVGTGSGVIAVSLAYYLSDAEITAVDSSPDALEVAKINAAKHSVVEKIDFRTGNLLADVSGIFDVVISNPPYIPTKTILSLQREIRNHEPREALDGGEEGLECIKSIIAQAPSCLEAGGMLLMEIGYDQRSSIELLISQSPSFATHTILCDYSGKDRLLCATKGTKEK